jgi:hypothetical protein
MNRSEYRVPGKGRLAFPYCRDRKYMRAFVTGVPFFAACILELGEKRFPRGKH